MFDLYIIKHNKTANNPPRISLNLLLTTSLALGLPSLINYYSLDNLSMKEAVRSSILVIPWNWLVVLQIEIFYFHLKQVQLEKEKNVYQFEALKNQINPHFLFNCLNVLSSLAYQNAEKTNLFAKKLSNVYRYLLCTHERPTVALAEELSFVDSYLFLEKIRHGDTLQIHLENDGTHQHLKLIPANIQLLVENAIKHNISTPQSPLHIRITVDRAGVTVANNLQLRNYVTKKRYGTGQPERNNMTYTDSTSVSLKPAQTSSSNCLSLKAKTVAAYTYLVPNASTKCTKFHESADISIPRIKQAPYICRE